MMFPCLVAMATHVSLPAALRILSSREPTVGPGTASTQTQPVPPTAAAGSVRAQGRPGPKAADHTAALPGPVPSTQKCHQSFPAVTLVHGLLFSQGLLVRGGHRYSPATFSSAAFVTRNPPFCCLPSSCRVPSAELMQTKPGMDTCTFTQCLSIM